MASDDDGTDRERLFRWPCSRAAEILMARSAPGARRPLRQRPPAAGPQLDGATRRLNNRTFAAYEVIANTRPIGRGVPTASANTRDKFSNRCLA